MKTYACDKCGSVDVFIDDRGNQKALMCGDCGSWLKWIGKKEVSLVERYIESNKVEPNQLLKDNIKFKEDTVVVYDILSTIITDLDRYDEIIFKQAIETALGVINN